MIVLPIHEQNDDDDTPQEWSLLELNGELITPKTETEGDSMELGKVTFDSEGSPIMTIASHELKGKIQPLKQKLVIMKPRNFKRPSSCSGGDITGAGSIANDENTKKAKRLKPNANGETDDMEVDEHNMGYEIAGVVTSKLLFDRYPKSIMR